MGDGNFFTINKYLKAEFEKIKVLSNLNMYLNELIENNCIYRIARGVYGINSLIAYCGALHNDANLSVKIFTRLDAEAKNNQPQQLWCEKTTNHSDVWLIVSSVNRALRR